MNKMIDAVLYIVLDKVFINFLSFLIISVTQIHKAMWGENLQSILVEISLMSVFIFI